MNKYKLAALLLIAFTAGETTMRHRARLHYTPIVEKLKTNNKSLRDNLEVEKLHKVKWRSAARGLDRGISYQEVEKKIEEDNQFIIALKQSL